MYYRAWRQEYLIMAQTRVRPHYLVEIHDAVLARNQLQLFKGLWLVGTIEKQEGGTLPV